MKILNDSQHTIYLDDIDQYIPHSNEVQEIDTDIVKRSRSFRSVVLNRKIKVISYDENEKVESSLMYLLNKTRTEPDAITSSDDMEDRPLISAASDKLEVKFHGLFYDASGYAKVNRNVALKLQESGISVRISPKQSQTNLDTSGLQSLVALEKTPIAKNHILIDSVIPSFGEMGSGRYKILYTTVESYSLQDPFLTACRGYEEIWATSDWAVSILKKYIKDIPIYAMHTGVDPILYTEEGDKFSFKPNIKDFVFIAVFGWSYRKGPDVLCKAYFDEFSSKDNVSLLIMSRYQSGKSRHHREKIKEDIDKYMLDFPNKDLPHLVRFNQQVAEKDMPKLYRACNAYISTTRGESFGLPQFEASLCGLPIIMTNCSGQQGYLRPDNSYMIEIDRVAPVPPGKFHIHYWDGHDFPQLTSPEVHSQVKQAMRSVYENYNEAKERNKNLQKLIFEQFTWTRTANDIIKRLKEIKLKLG